MSLILDGTNGLSDVDGTAAAPAIRGTDTNTGIFFPAADTIGFAEGGAEAMRIDSSGNVGIGTTTPLSLGAGYSTLDIRGSNGGGFRWGNSTNSAYTYADVDGVVIATATAKPIILSTNNTERARIDSSGNVGIGTSSPAATLTVAHASGVDGRGIRLVNSSNSQTWETRIGVQGLENTSYAIKDITAGAVRFLIDTSGNLLVGTTSAVSGARISAVVSGQQAAAFRSDASTTTTIVNLWGNETSGNQIFVRFATDSNAERGSITYNRAGGLVAYNTTSDYRTKTINGAVQNALSKVALLKPSTGRMNGATENIDFFVAHELQQVVPSAVTGEKDAIDADGNPQYQMVDKSAIIPLLTAALQEAHGLIKNLEQRVAALEAV